MMLKVYFVNNQNLTKNYNQDKLNILFLKLKNLNVG